MKPKGKKNDGKKTITKLNNARRKLSLPLLTSGHKTDVTGGNAAGASTRPQVTSLYTRPDSLPFNTSSSASAAANSKRFDPKGFGIGTSFYQQQSSSFAGTSFNKLTHSVKENMAVNRGQSNQSGSSAIASVGRGQAHQERKMKITLDEARKALSLDKVDLKPKFNVNRLTLSPKPTSGPKKEQNASAGTKSGGTKAEFSLVKANRSAILKAVSIGEALVADVVETAQQRMKRIRFADEITKTSVSYKPVPKKK